VKRLAILSDMQIPYHDQRALDNVLEFLVNEQFDYIYNVGDELDAPQPSRWNKSMAGEYAGTLQKHIETNYYIQEQIALLSDNRYAIMRSNHVDRIETYIRRYAPAFGALDVLKIESLLGYDELGIQYFRQPAQIAPGWVLAHGDEAGLIRTAGGTALSLARKLGQSVVCGHTHRAGIQHEHPYFNGRTLRQLWGMEVGNLMDMKKAQYLKAGGANWQQAIGELVVDGRHVTPKLHFIQGGKIR